MNTFRKSTKLDRVMTMLGLSANRLSRVCGVSNSLISRWQNGNRSLTARSKALRPLAEALLTFDTEGKLDKQLAPWLMEGESKTEALCRYLIEEEVPALPVHEKALTPQRTGSYLVEHQALLGARGFRKAALLMLDYLTKLPPGQQVLVCAHNRFDLWHGDLTFALQFLWKMKEAVKRGTTFTLVNCDTIGRDGSPWFSLYWITIHLKGFVRSRCYKGEAPDEYFMGVIPGCWSGRMEPDDTAEDGLLVLLTTDPRSIRKDEAYCKTYIEKSVPGSQFGFLKMPLGDQQNYCRWKPGSLPRWCTPNAPSPSGNFSAIYRTPSFGVMTKQEFSALLTGDESPVIPDYLFRNNDFAPGPHRLILCREDVQEGLRNEHMRNEPLSQLLHRDVYVPREMLVSHMERLLAEMKKRKDFEVALMPRSAFAKLEMELIYWHNSAALGWLQDGRESMLDVDHITAGSFYSGVNYTWSRLHKGWKRYRNVSAALRNWLSGSGLDEKETDSVIVEHWDILPKE